MTAPWLPAVEAEIRSAGKDELGRLRGELARLDSLILVRLGERAEDDAPLRIEEAEKMSGLSRATLYRRPEFQRRSGRCVRFSRRAIKEYLGGKGDAA